MNQLVRLRFYKSACVYLAAMWLGLIVRGSSGGRLTDAALFVFAIAAAVLSAENERRRLRRKGLYRGNGLHD